MEAVAPTLRFENGDKVVPGDRIGTLRQVFPGVGTYAKSGHVYASVLGQMNVSVTPTSSQDDTTMKESTMESSLPQFTVSVTPQNPLASTRVIRVGQRVLGRISRIAAPQATLEILAMEGVGPLHTLHGNNNGMMDSPPLEGSIPREECYKAGSTGTGTPSASAAATTTAGREIHECFQPGDLVLAQVLSLGDARRYFLTTAEPDLGVIHAICHASGKPMIPCSWNQMECPETGIKEARKCAKPSRSRILQQQQH